MNGSREQPERGTGPRLWTPVFVAILAVALCCFTVGQGINSGTSVYIDRLGGTSALAGVGAAVFSVAAAVARVVSGPIIDLRGRVVVMGAGAVVYFAGVLGAAISASLDLFLLWRVLQGVGFSVLSTAAATAAADVLPAQRLGEGIGYYGLGQAFGLSFGPALGMVLVSSDPAENLYWGMSALAVIGICLTLLCRYEGNPDRLPETSAYRMRALERAKGEECSGSTRSAEAGVLDGIFEPGALAGALPMMAVAPAVGFVLFFGALFGTSAGIGNAAVLYTVGAVAMVVVRFASGSYMDRTAPIKIFGVAVACGLLAFALLLAVAVSGVQGVAKDAMFYAAGIPYGVFLGISLPVNQTVAVKNSSAERWGAANGMFLLLYDIAIGAGTVVWGITNDAFGFAFTIVCVLVFVAAAFCIALVTYPRDAR